LEECAGRGNFPSLHSYFSPHPSCWFWSHGKCEMR